MTSEIIKFCQKLSLHSLSLTFVFFAYSHSQANSCVPSVAHRDYHLPHEVVELGSGN
jgi:hypothetical protein